MEMREVLRVLSSEVNIKLLSLLSTRAMNSRELAGLLKRDETDVSRRLRTLERAGLVGGRWERIRGRNVRVYSLKIDELKIRFEPGEVKLEGEMEGGSGLLGQLGGERPEPEVFVGRKGEIELIKERSEPVVVVYGMAGMGKTSLVARAFRDAFWYRITGLESLEHLLWKLGLFLNSKGYSQLVEYLRSGGKSEAVLMGLAWEGLASTAVVLVLDDFHLCGDDGITRFLRFLAGRGNIGGAKVVLTSRVKPSLGAEGVFYLKLGGLAPEEAYELAKAKGISLTPEEFASAYILTRGHPLAFTLFVEARLAGRSWNRENFFEFLFEEVYRSLSEHEKALLGLLSIFSEPVHYEALKRMYPRKDLFPVLYSLMNRGLVERVEDGYVLHDIIRGFARETFREEPRKYYLTYADYLLEKDSPENFLRAVKYVMEAGAVERFKELAGVRLRRFRNVPVDFPKTYLKILSGGGNNPYVEAERAEVEFQRGFFDRAERMWLRVKDGLGGLHKANVLTFLADLYLEKKEFEKAEEYLGKSRELAEQLNDPLAWLWYEMEETKYLYFVGRTEEALESAFKELKFARRAKVDPDTEALVLLHIGDILVNLRRYEEAVDYYLRSKDIAEAGNSRFRASIAYFELAKAYYNLGRFEEAAEFARKAADYFLGIRNYRRVVDSMAYLTVSLIGLGSLSEAEKVSKEMVKIGQATSYPLSWAGYTFLGTIETLHGRDGSEYFQLGLEHLKDDSWLYSAILKSLGKVFDVEGIPEVFKSRGDS